MTVNGYSQVMYKNQPNIYKLQINVYKDVEVYKKYS
jgi:hypothetical protein